jgi:membrane-associated phospholipid phosphatase
MPGSLLLFMFKDKEAFLRLCFIMFGGMTIALGVYWICPNGVAIRVPVEGSGIAANLCRFLQTIDPPTNVCPSIHVSSSVAIDIAVQGSAMFRKNKPVRILSFIIMLAISASTAFVKQHSLWDIAAGAVMSIGLMLVYDKLIVRKKEMRNAAENISGRA